MSTPKPVPGEKLAPMQFPKLGGGVLEIGGTRENWTLFVVYRGKHCPRCKAYLNTLDAMAADWADAGIDIAVVSADPEEKAKIDLEEFGWGFPLGYGMNEDQMHQLGLYVSDPLSPDETDRRFAEPGVFVLWPDGTQFLISISNGPSARPDLAQLLDGMIFSQRMNRPPRGTV